MSNTRLIALATLVALFTGGTVAASGCGDSGTSNNQGGSGGQSSTSTTSGMGGDVGFDAGNGDADLDPDSACVAQSAAATFYKKPVDIIVIVDNSSSMTDEIIGVQNNINKNFATIIENSGLDYQVIMLTEHGSVNLTQSVCIEAPLSAIPAGGCASPPPKPGNNPPKFNHFSTPIGSHDPLCKIFTTMYSQDSFGEFPNGWIALLRPEALKTFIVLTDDNPNCGSKFNDLDTVDGGNAMAEQFANELFAISPVQFGSKANPNFTFYSIVGVAPNSPATAPYQPTDPIVTSVCPTAVRSATGYQALSIMTGGLRFPLCDTSSYSSVFQAIAKGVVQSTKVVCEFPVPDAPQGQSIDLSTVIVQYKPSGTGSQVLFSPVADANTCKDGSFYIAKDMNGKDTIYLCPQTCSVVQEDLTAKINVLYGCALSGMN